MQLTCTENHQLKKLRKNPHLSRFQRSLKINEFLKEAYRKRGLRYTPKNLRRKSKRQHVNFIDNTKRNETNMKPLLTASSNTNKNKKIIRTQMFNGTLIEKCNFNY